MGQVWLHTPSQQLTVESWGKRGKGAMVHCVCPCLCTEGPYSDSQSGNVLPHMAFLCCSVQEKKPLLMGPVPNIGDRNLIISDCVYS